MGTPISIDIPETGDGKVFKAAFERLIQIDERFSTYKKASEVSRFRDGEWGESELSPELALVIKNCRDWEKKTGGFFSSWADGLFDPSGYVKGWAIAETGKVIEEAGFKTYCVGAGGDILARSAGAKKWRIGIQDPTDQAKILNK
jgi:thiamine biosynthesis lipoprotein